MKVGVEGTEDQGGSQGHPVETSRQRHPVGTCGGLSPQRGVGRVSVQLYRWWLKLGQNSERLNIPQEKMESAQKYKIRLWKEKCF